MGCKEKTTQEKGFGICCGLKVHVLKAVFPMKYSEIGLLDHDWFERVLT